MERKFLIVKMKVKEEIEKNGIDLTNVSKEETNEIIQYLEGLIYPELVDAFAKIWDTNYKMGDSDSFTSYSNGGKNALLDIVKSDRELYKYSVLPDILKRL